MENNKIKQLETIINEGNKIVFFGGAGVSTESGIPDFRSQDGLYNKRYKYPPEIIISHTFYLQNKAEFFKFYFENMIYADAKPNAAHLYLANLEKTSKLKAVITQNIDGLHQAAGSNNVYELHGSIHRNYCENCGRFYDLSGILAKQPIPFCDTCAGVIKPNVVLYEESLEQNTLINALDAISKADVLIIGGTSLKVYPAANLINYFKGEHLVVINKDASPADHQASLVINAPIGETFARLTAI